MFILVLGCLYDFSSSLVYLVFSFIIFLFGFVISYDNMDCIVTFADIDEYYADVRYERIAILNALGAYYSYLGKIETKTREKEEHFILATQYYNKASIIDMHEPSTWIGKGGCKMFFYFLFIFFVFHNLNKC